MFNTVQHMNYHAYECAMKDRYAARTFVKALSLYQLAVSCVNKDMQEEWFLAVFCAFLMMYLFQIYNDMFILFIDECCRDLLLSCF